MVAFYQGVLEGLGEAVLLLLYLSLVLGFVFVGDCLLQRYHKDDNTRR